MARGHMENDNLVERLRQPFRSGEPINDLCIAAAAEIERLRAENARLNAFADHEITTCAELRARAERAELERDTQRDLTDEWAARAQKAEAERDELRFNHPAEGTVLCTCNSYPHKPTCGESERMALLKAELAAARDSESHFIGINIDLEQELSALRADAEKLRYLLIELVAQVRGECPSLLDEDSGGDARLSMAIDDAIDAARGKP